MPTTSGFANAPISKYLVAYTVISALLVTATDTKYYFHLLPVPHLFGTPFSGQWWRMLTWPLCYTNSTEVLFAGMTFYQMRVVERLWGSRKFASFLLTTLPYTVVIPPIILLVLRLLTAGSMNHLPAGPTSLAFALLAQYQAAIPYTFRYHVSTTSPPLTATGTNASRQSAFAGEKGITFTSKSTFYLLPLQLALSQLPGSLIPASVGWIVGHAWRAEILPTFPGRNWRLPGWVIGEKNDTSRVRAANGAMGAEGLEQLQRRMERDGGQASGVQGSLSSAGVERRRYETQ